MPRERGSFIDESIVLVKLHSFNHIQEESAIRQRGLLKGAGENTDVHVQLIEERYTSLQSFLGMAAILDHVSLTISAYVMTQCL